MSKFDLSNSTRILDLGGFDGSHISDVLQERVHPSNVYVADIDKKAISQASSNFGFSPVLITETGALPFPDCFFDIVFCSSVIEHVTVPKEIVWTIHSGRKFREASRRHQSRFAAEIRRVTKGYFVQVPYRWFLIETHSWLPFMGYLPRRALLPVLRITNRVWIKRTVPDFYLPTVGDMSSYFPDGKLLRERVLGMTKSLILYKAP